MLITVLDVTGPGTPVRVLLAIVFSSWCTSGSTASAQIASGALSGIVRDGSGAAVAGASIVLTDVATRATRSALSLSDGTYRLTALTPGAYVLRVELQGFRPLVRDGIRILTGEAATVDVRLEVGRVDEAVRVTADIPLVRSDSSSLGQTIDNNSIVTLPLNGRTFIALAALAPGVALPPGSAFPRINGGRPRTNEYLFDGISVLQPEPGQVAFFPNVDAIQEFRVESNSPPAEFGRFNGGVVNLTTRAGGNEFHGTAFEFLRNEALNARNVFASTTAARPRFRRNQFGGVLGGPIRQNRTFFFGDYQSQRQSIGRTAISTVPTVLQRQGIFTEAIGGRVAVIYDPATGVAGANRIPFAGNVIPLDRFDPAAKALLERYPLPTSAGTANNYRRLDTETVDQDQIGGRIDHRVSVVDQLFGRFTYFRETFIPVLPLPDGSGLASGTLGPQRTQSTSFASSYRRELGRGRLNELRVGDTRRRVRRSAAGVNDSASRAVGIPGIPTSAAFADTLPTFLIAGYQQLGSPPNSASRFETSVTQIADTFTWVRAGHTFKFGGDLRWERLNILQPPSPAGSFTFSSVFTDLPGTPNTGTPLASFLLGQVQQFSIDLQQDEIRNRAHVEEFFAQDDWRLTPRLTLNAGVRYTLNFPSVEANNQAAVFNLQTQQLEFLGRDGRPRAARQLHKANFGPRLGLAGVVSNKTVVRAGYALVWIEMAGITTPFTTPVFPFLQTVSQRTLDNITPAFVLSHGPSVQPVPLTPAAGVGQGVFAVDRDLGSGYVQQWNVSAQRELSSRIAVEAAYAGSTITHVGIPDTNLNQLTVGQLALGPALLQRVPNPYFGIIPRSSSLGDPTIPVGQLLKPYPQYTTVSLYRNNVGTTIYHGAYVKLEQRPLRGLSYLVSYTRSRLVDDASSVFDTSILTGPVANYPVADSFNRHLERDYSTGDIPHVFVASAVWNPSFLNGWSIAGVLTMQSGVPIAVTQATNNNAFAGFGTQRPNLIGDPTLPADERSVSRWFNTDAFATAPQFTIGSSTRNPVRGPGYRNLDVAVIKRLALGGAAQMELRAEAFNLTNTRSLGAPNGTFGTAAFGSITSAGDPRVVQVAAKFLF